MLITFNYYTSIADLHILIYIKAQAWVMDVSEYHEINCMIFVVEMFINQIRS